MEPSIYIGDLPLILDDLSEVEGPKGQLDTANFSVLCDPATWRVQLEALGIVRNDPLPLAFGYASMWCNAITPGERSSKTIHIGVSCVGLTLWDSKMKVSLRGNEKRISVGPNEPTPALLRDGEGELIITDPRGRFVHPDGSWILRPSFPSTSIGGDSAGGPALSIGYGSLSVSATYFAKIRPSTGEVGTVKQPPAIDLDEPFVSEIGGSYMYLRKAVPHGWILTSREVESLFEDGRMTGSEGASGVSGLFAAKDEYTFVLAAEPA